MTGPGCARRQAAGKRAADNKSARNVEYEMWPDDAPKSETAKGAAAGADDDDDDAFKCTRVQRLRRVRCLGNIETWYSIRKYGK